MTCDLPPGSCLATQTLQAASVRLYAWSCRLPSTVASCLRSSRLVLKEEDYPKRRNIDLHDPHKSRIYLSAAEGALREHKDTTVIPGPLSLNPSTRGVVRLASSATPDPEPISIPTSPPAPKLSPRIRSLVLLFHRDVLAALCFPLRPHSPTRHCPIAWRDSATPSHPSSTLGITSRLLINHFFGGGVIRHTSTTLYLHRERLALNCTEPWKIRPRKSRLKRDPESSDTRDSNIHNQDGFSIISRADELAGMVAACR